MGEWERKTAYWWVYRVAGREAPFADVLCQQQDGPNGPVWDAIPVPGMQPLVEGVSLDEAKAAVEREAGRLPYRATGAGP